MLSLNSSGIYCAIVISLSHSLSSIGPSLFMGLLMNKSYTRLCDAFFFISSILCVLLLFFLLANNNFPSSINSIGEIFALSNLFLFIRNLTQNIVNGFRQKFIYFLK